MKIAPNITMNQRNQKPKLRRIGMSSSPQFHQILMMLTLDVRVSMIVDHCYSKALLCGRSMAEKRSTELEETKQIFQTLGQWVNLYGQSGDSNGSTPRGQLTDHQLIVG